MAGDLSNPIKGLVLESFALISSNSQVLAEEALFGPQDVTIELSGSVSGFGVVAANLITLKYFQENVDGESQVDGALTLSLEVNFEGDSDTFATLVQTNSLSVGFQGTGVIEGTIPNPINALLGEIEGEAFVVGGIFKILLLSVAFTGDSEIEATIPPEIKLFSGSLTGTSSMSGSIVQLPQCLVAPAIGSGTISSQLILALPSSSLEGDGDASAALTQIHDLRGDLTGVGSFDGEISNVYEGHAEGSGTAQGSLAQQPQLISLDPVEGTGSLEGFLVMSLESSISGDSGASGFLQVIKRLNAEALGSGEVEGYLVQQPQAFPIALVDGFSNVLGFLQGLAPLEGEFQGSGEVVGVLVGGRETLLGQATGSGNLSDGLRVLKYLSGTLIGNGVIAEADLFVIKFLEDSMTGVGESIGDLTRTNIISAETQLGGIGNIYARGRTSSVFRKRGPRG